MNFKIDQALLVVDPKGFVFEELQLPSPRGLITQQLTNQHQLSNRFLTKNWSLYSPKEIVELDYQLSVFIKQLNRIIREYNLQASEKILVSLETQLLEKLQVYSEVIKRAFFYEIALDIKKFIKNQHSIASLFLSCDNFQILRIVSEILLRFEQAFPETTVLLEDYQQAKCMFSRVVFEPKPFATTPMNIFEHKQVQQEMKKLVFEDENHKKIILSDYQIDLSQSSRSIIQGLKVKLNKMQKMRISVYIRLLKGLNNHTQLGYYIEMSKNLFLFKSQQFVNQNEYWNNLYNCSLELIINNSNYNFVEPVVQVNQILSSPYSDTRFVAYLKQNSNTNYEQSLILCNFYSKNSNDLDQKLQIDTFVHKVIEKIMDKKIWQYAEDVFEFLECSQDGPIEMVFEAYLNIIKQAIECSTNIDVFKFQTSFMHFFKFYLCSQKTRESEYYKKIVNKEFLERILKKLSKKEEEAKNKRILHFIFNQSIYFCLSVPEFDQYFSQLMKHTESLKLFTQICLRFYENNQILFKLNFKILHKIVINQKYILDSSVRNFYWSTIMKMYLLWGPKSYLEQEISSTNDHYDMVIVKLMEYLQSIAKNHDREQRSLKKYLDKRQEYDPQYMVSWLKVVAFKNRLLSQNLLFISVSLKQHIPESHFKYILKLVGELTTPLIIGKNKYTNVLSSYYEEFESATIEYPLQCLELSHSYFKKWVNFDLKCISNLSANKLFWNHFWNVEREQFFEDLTAANGLTSENYKILEQLRNLEFYLTLFNSVVDKIKDEVKNSISHIREVYQICIIICVRVAESFSNVISREVVENIYQKSLKASMLKQVSCLTIFNDKQYKEMEREELTKNNSSMGFHKQHINQVYTLIKQIEILKECYGLLNTKEYQTLIEHDVRSNIDISYTGLNYQYIAMGRTIELIRTIQKYCSSVNDLEKKIKFLLLTPLSEENLIYLSSRFRELQYLVGKINPKELYFLKLSELLIKQLRRYFITYLIHDLLALNNAYTQEQFCGLLKHHVELYKNILVYVHSVLGFYEETHNIFVEALEINISLFIKTKQNKESEKLVEYKRNLQAFIIEIFNMFLFSTFKIDTRVRRATFYDPINKYQVITFKGRKCFNNSILFYLSQNFNRFIKFQLTEEMKSLVEEDVNIEKYDNVSMEDITVICTQAMIVNLLARNNFMVLSQGIKNIFKGDKGVEYYLRYLIEVSKLLQTNKNINQNDLETIIIDVYGNLEIILEDENNENIFYLLIELMQIIFQIKVDMKEIRSNVIKILLNEIFLRPNVSKFQKLQMHHEGYPAFMLLAVSYQAKLISRCKSYLHLLNVLYLDRTTTKNIRANWPKILENFDESVIHQEAIKIMNQNSNDLFLRDHSVEVTQIEELINSFICELIKYLNKQSNDINYYLYIKLIIALAIKFPSLIDQIFYFEIDIERLSTLTKKPITHLEYYKDRQSITFVELILDTLEYSFRIAIEFIIFILKTNSGFEMQKTENILMSSNYIKTNLLKQELMNRLSMLKFSSQESTTIYFINLIKVLEFLIKKQDSYLFSLYKSKVSQSEIVNAHRKSNLMYIDSLVVEIFDILDKYSNPSINQPLLNLLHECLAIKFTGHSHKQAEVQDNLKFYLNDELMRVITNGDNIVQSMYNSEVQTPLQFESTMKEPFVIDSLSTKTFENSFLSKVYHILEVSEEQEINKECSNLRINLGRTFKDEIYTERVELYDKIVKDLSDNCCEEYQMSQKRLQLPSFDQRSISLNAEDDIFFQNDEFIMSDAVQENKLETNCSSICDIVIDEQETELIESENKQGLIRRVEKLELMTDIELNIDITNKIQYLSNDQLLQLETITQGRLRWTIEKQKQLRGLSSGYRNKSEKLILSQIQITLNNEIYKGCKKNIWISDMIKQNKNIIPSFTDNINLSLIDTLMELIQDQEAEGKMQKLIQLVSYNNKNISVLSNYMFWILTLKQNEIKILQKQNVEIFNRIILKCVMSKNYLEHIKISICRLLSKLMNQKIGLPIWLFADFNLKTMCIDNFSPVQQLAKTQSVLQRKEVKKRLIEIVIEIIIESKNQNDYCEIVQSFENYIEFSHETKNIGYPAYEIDQQFEFTDDDIVVNLVTKFINNKKRLKQGEIYNNIFKVLLQLFPGSYEILTMKLLESVGEDLKIIIESELKEFARFRRHFSYDKEKLEQINSNQERLQRLIESYEVFSVREKCLEVQENMDKLQYLRHLISDFCFDLIPWLKQRRFEETNKEQILRWQKKIRQNLKEIHFAKKMRNLQQLQKAEYKHKIEESEFKNWKNKIKNQFINDYLKPIHSTFSINLLGSFLKSYQLFESYSEMFNVKESNYSLINSVYKKQSYVWKIILAYSSIFVEQETNGYHTMSILKTNENLKSKKQLTSGKILHRRSVKLSIHTVNPYSLNVILKRFMKEVKFINTFLKQGSRLIKILSKEGGIDLKIKFIKKKKNGNVKEIQIERDKIWFDTIMCLDQDFIEKDIRIKFKNELGIDYGGLTREWLTLITKQLFNPHFGLFEVSANKLTVQPSRNSHLVPMHLMHFKKLGMLVGKSLIEDWNLEINFTKSFLKHLLGNTLYVQDLFDIDPDLARSLVWILNNEVDQSLEITFSYEQEIFGEKKLVNLIENGLNIFVNETNKKDYVKLICRHRMTDQIRPQAKAFMEGLEQVIPYETLKCLNYKELGLYLAGLPTVNLNQMKQYAKYNNYDEEDITIQWLWQILKDFDIQTLSNFLFFLTGSFKVPYEGFKEYPITINKSFCKEFLPVAHTCFNTIDLPEYQSKKSMEKKLKMAISEGKGFNVS